MTYGVRWTPEEDASLCRLYPNPELTIDQVAEMLKRTRAAVVGRSNKLGVSRPGGRPAGTRSIIEKHERTPRVSRTDVPAMPDHPYWTAELDFRVWQTQGLHGRITRLAAALGKPICAVRQRWFRLKAEAA